MTRPPHSALLLCDVWDTHWCKSAAAGTQRLAQTLASVAADFRAGGGQVIHAPSDTMEAYAQHPARIWVQDLPRVPSPPPRTMPDWPLPTDPRPQCPDAPSCDEPTGPPWPWTRQHPAIEIQPSDAILDSGDDLLAVINRCGIAHIYIGGVHTNMCILERPFAIKQMVRWGIACSLAIELTEAMPASYTPAVCRYIAQHWCPAVTTSELLGASH